MSEKRLDTIDVLHKFGHCWMIHNRTNLNAFWQHLHENTVDGAEFQVVEIGFVGLLNFVESPFQSIGKWIVCKHFHALFDGFAGRFWQ